MPVLTRSLSTHLISVFGHINVQLFQCGNCIKFIIYRKLFHNVGDGMITDLWKLSDITVKLLHHFAILWYVLYWIKDKAKKIRCFKIRFQTKRKCHVVCCCIPLQKVIYCWVSLCPVDVQWLSKNP